MENINKNGVPFENPLGGFSGRIEWENEPKKRIKQAFIIVVLYIVLLALTPLVPIAYIAHLWELKSEKRKLKSEIAREHQKPTNIETPTIKALDAFWQLHGLDQYKFDSVERFELLSRWVSILYGEKMQKSLHLEQRIEAITKSHFEANRPYYEKQEGAPHFHFIPPLECLISELTEELPYYDQIA